MTSTRSPGEVTLVTAASMAPVPEEASRMTSLRVCKKACSFLSVAVTTARNSAVRWCMDMAAMAACAWGSNAVGPGVNSRSFFSMGFAIRVLRIKVSLRSWQVHGSSLPQQLANLRRGGRGHRRSPKIGGHMRRVGHAHQGGGHAGGRADELQRQLGVAGGRGQEPAQVVARLVGERLEAALEQAGGGDHL